MLAGHPLAQHRTDPDADREGSQQERYRRFAAPQHELAVGRELGQEQRAVQPEPRDAEDGQEDGAVLAGEGDVAPGFGQRVEIDLQFRGRGWRRGDAPAGQVAGQCHDEAANGNPHRMRHRTGQQPAGQRADQDGDEGASLDQRIAADQLLFAQVLRQDRVLDRPEQGRMAAEQEQRPQQHRQAVEHEAGQRDQHDRHFQHLHEAGQACLVVFVGELSGGGREQEEGQDEDARGQVGQDGRVQAGPAGRLEGEQYDQGVLEQVVVEGAEKLGAEEGQEAALARCLIVALVGAMAHLRGQAGDQRDFHVKTLQDGICQRRHSHHAESQEYGQCMVNLPGIGRHQHAADRHRNGCEKTSQESASEMGFRIVHCQPDMFHPALVSNHGATGQQGKTDPGEQDESIEAGALENGCEQQGRRCDPKRITRRMAKKGFDAGQTNALGYGQLAGCLAKPRQREEIATHGAPPGPINRYGRCV